jgi:hypothetical protein
MSTGKAARLHLTGGKSTAKKTKTFNYKDQAINIHSNTVIKNQNSKLKNDLIVRNKNFAYGEGMENIINGPP